MGTVFVNGATAAAQAQPEDPDLCSGRQVAYHPEITPPPAPDRWYPGQPDSARPGSGRPIVFQSPLVHRKVTCKPIEIHIDETLWYVVGYSERNLHVPKMIAEKVTRVLRPEPHFHNIDGACQRY